MWNVQESNTVLEEGIHLILGAERAEREWHRFQDARFGGTEKIGGFHEPCMYSHDWQG